MRVLSDRQLRERLKDAVQRDVFDAGGAVDEDADIRDLALWVLLDIADLIDGLGESLDHLARVNER